MRVVQDGVDVYILPDNAYCAAYEEKRSPLELDSCPCEKEACSGDCLYYREDDDK